MSYFMAPTVDNPFAMGTGLGAHQAAAGVHFRRSDDATSSILRDSFKLEKLSPLMISSHVTYLPMATPVPPS